MKKILNILIILIFSQLLTLMAVAGSDGALEINKQTENPLRLRLVAMKSIPVPMVPAPVQPKPIK